MKKAIRLKMTTIKNTATTLVSTNIATIIFITIEMIHMDIATAIVTSTLMLLLFTSLVML